MDKETDILNIRTPGVNNGSVVIYRDMMDLANEQLEEAKTNEEKHQTIAKDMVEDLAKLDLQIILAYGMPQDEYRALKAQFQELSLECDFAGKRYEYWKQRAHNLRLKKSTIQKSWNQLNGQLRVEHETKIRQAELDAQRQAGIEKRQAGIEKRQAIRDEKKAQHQQRQNARQEREQAALAENDSWLSRLSFGRKDQS